MDQGPNTVSTAKFGEQVDFGRTASDYRKFRAGFPDAFFDRLLAQLGLETGRHCLDLGTGTGTVARGLALRGLRITAIDPSPDLMREAAELDQNEGVCIDYGEGRAEALPFGDQTFDLVTAGQCWHWFQRHLAAAEAFRVLKLSGSLVIAHFDWLPLRGSVVEATEHMILEANPSWTMAGGTGMYPQWLGDMSDAGFINITTRSFDMVQPYSHEAWRGRIRASAGIKATLDQQATSQFDERLKAMLAERCPDDPLQIPHRVWWVTARRPE